MTTYDEGHGPECRGERRGCGPAASVCVVLAACLPWIGIYVLKLHPLLLIGLMVGLVVLGVWLSIRRGRKLDREEKALHEDAVRAQSCTECGAPYSDGGTVTWCKFSGSPLLGWTNAKCGRCGTESIYGMKDTFADFEPPKS